MSLFIRSVGLKLEYVSESPVGLVEPQIASPIPGESIQQVWAGPGKFACLTSVR